MLIKWLKWSLIVGPLVLLTIFSLYLINYLERENIDEYLMERQLAVRVAYNTVLDLFFVAAQKDHFYLSQRDDVIILLREFKTASDARKAYLRGLLYRKLYKNYQQMRLVGVRQFHFHTVNGDSLLRFHMPSKSGDPLILFRHSIHLANRELKSSYGFEAGRITGGFRYVFPLMQDDELLGSVEFSLSFEALVDKIRIANPDIVAQLIMNRENSIEKVFNAQLDSFQVSLLSDQYYIESAELSATNKNFLLDPTLRGIQINLREQADIADKLATQRDFSTLVEFASEHYIVNFITVSNTESHPAGYIVNYQKFSDYSDITQQFNSLRWIWVASFVVIWGLIFKITKQYNTLNNAQIKLRENNNLLTQAQSLANFGSWEYNFNSNQVTVSESIHNILEIQQYPIHLSVSDWMSFTHPLDANRILYAFLKSIRSCHDFHEQHRIITRSDKTLYIDHYARHEYDETGRPVRSTGTIYDVTEKAKEFEKVQTILDIMSSITILTDSEGLRFVNKSFLEFFNVTSLAEFQQITPCICERFEAHEHFFSIPDKTSSDANTHWIKQMQQLSHRSRVVLMADKYQTMHAFFVHINHYDETNFIVEFTDITDTMQDKIELQNRLQYDELTRAYSRAFFSTNIDTIVADLSQDNKQLAVLFIDIDHFKRVNDHFGHHIGDRVLTQFAKLINDTIRKQDFLIRFGGEEFLVLYSCEQDELALKLAEKLIETVASHQFAEVDCLTCSIGLAIHQPSQNVETTIENADKMLYAAKNAGRNQVKYYA